MSYVNLEETKANKKCLFCVFLSIVIIISTGGFIVYSLAYNHGILIGLASLLSLQPPHEEPLPKKFSLYEDFFSSCFSGITLPFIRSFEFQYKQQGLGYGYYSKSKNTRFSHLGFAGYVKKICMQIPNDTDCLMLSDPDNFLYTLNQFPMWMDKFKHFEHSIIPYSCCGLEQSCPQLDFCINNNPLLFIYESKTFIKGINAMKRSLLSARRPLSFFVSEPLYRYSYQCDANNDDYECIHKIHLCEGNNSNYCYTRSFKTMSIPNIAMYLISISDIDIGSRIPLTLVGYNDNFIPYQEQYGVSTNKGGFIFEIPFEFSAHSHDYLLGKIGKEEESKRCPNAFGVYFWKPAYQKNVSHYETRNATELICIDSTYCSPNSTYFLLLNPENNVTKFSFTENFIPVSRLLQIDTDGKTNVWTMNDVPYPFLPTVFARKQTLKDQNEVCRFLFLSNKMLQMITSKGSVSKEGCGAYDFIVKWDKRSYPESGSSFNYTEVFSSSFSMSFSNLFNNL